MFLLHLLWEHFDAGEEEAFSAALQGCLDPRSASDLVDKMGLWSRHTCTAKTEWVCQTERAQLVVAGEAIASCSDDLSVEKRLHDLATAVEVETCYTTDGMMAGVERVVLLAGGLPGHLAGQTPGPAVFRRVKALADMLLGLTQNSQHMGRSECSMLTETAMILVVRLLELFVSESGGRSRLINLMLNNVGSNFNEHEFVQISSTVRNMAADLLLPLSEQYTTVRRAFSTLIEKANTLDSAEQVVAHIGDGFAEHGLVELVRVEATC